MQSRILRFMVIGVVFMPQFLFAQKRISVLLETVGVMAVQGVYLTYMSIGAAADGNSKKTYSDEMTIKLMSEFIRIAQVAKAQLKKLISTKAVVGDDVAFVRDLGITYKLLIDEATGYNDYLKNKNDKDSNVKIEKLNEYLDNYTKNRKKAWKKIRKLHGGSN